VTAAALARGWYHLLDRHRIDDAVGYLADDFRGHGMGSDRHGFRAEAVAWLEAFPDLHITVDRLVGDHNTVAARLILRGTHRGRFAGVSPTGRAIDITGVDLLLEQSGKFVEAWSLRDLTSLWVQLGTLPRPGTIHPTQKGPLHDHVDDHRRNSRLRPPQQGRH
jgi:predicted ester cyclase